jgi:hypothetical protein
MARLRQQSAVPVLGGYAEPRPGYEFLGPAHQGGFPERILLPNGHDWCTDIVGQFTEVNPLFIEKKRLVAGYYNGPNGSYYSDVDWVLLYEVGFVAPPSRPAPTQNEQMTHALSVTSPNVPSWNGVNALYELKDFRDIPLLLHNVGYEVLHGKNHGAKPISVKTVANSYLSWNFGMAPLIQDLHSCLNFVKATESRIRELRHDARPGGASSSATTYRDTSPAVYAGTGYFADHYGATAQYDVYNHTDIRNWGSVSWQVPKDHLPPQGSLAEYTYAASLANGLANVPNALWQAMPWTWLIDWFSNIDDFIKIGGNVLGASSGRMCLMEHTNNWGEIRPHANVSGFSPSSGGAQVVWKKRTPVSYVYPDVHLPFLTLDMVAILSTLAIQRAPIGKR